MSGTARPTLTKLSAALRRAHGKPVSPAPRSAFEWILWENCAYLATREKRAAAFALLKRSVGTTPKAIICASREALIEVTSHGTMAELFAGKLRDCALLKLGCESGRQRTA